MAPHAYLDTNPGHIELRDQARRESQSWGEGWWLHAGNRKDEHIAPPLQGPLPHWGRTLSELQRSDG